MSALDMYDDGTYLRNHPTWHAEDSAWKARKILLMLEKHALRPNTICEIGCGAGQILSELHTALPNAELHGYEISPQAYSLCRPEPGVAFHLGDIFLDDRFFDLGLMVDVLEHVPDYLGFLTRFRSKATHKIFHIPLDLSAQSVLRGSPLLQQRESAGHLHYFTRRTALATLEYAGYEVLDWFYTAGAIDVPQASLRGRAAVLPRLLLYRVSKPLCERLLGGLSVLVLAR
jgi:hypothetical protein